jgi:hypothetical protein
MDKNYFDDHIRKCNDTFTFLKISDFIKENMNNLDQLTLFDINNCIYNIKTLIKSCDKDLVKKSIERIEDNFYNDENIKELEVEENYVRKLLQYYELLKKWKLKINKN